MLPLCVRPYAFSRLPTLLWQLSVFFQRSVDEVGSALLATGLLSNARDPHPGGFVSARDTLGWISSANCSVAVSTCPASDTSAELLLVTAQTRTSLHVVVVLTLVVTIFTDTASIVDQADLLKSSSHRGLAASTAATLSRVYQPSGLRCTSRLASSLRSRVWPLEHSIVCQPFDVFVTLDVNCQRPDIVQQSSQCWSNGRSSCRHRRLPVSSARATHASSIHTICS